MSAANDPIVYSVAVTPHDTNEINRCRALLVTGSGAVKVKYANGVTCIVHLTQGHWHFMDVVQVYSTDTAATGIVAGY